MTPLSRRAALAATAAAAALPPSLLAPGPAGAQATAAAPAVADPSPPPGERPLFGATLWTLPNGLRVVHAENRRAPVVAHHLHYAVGAGDDPPGRSGVAHFLEHMMFKGSPRVASGEFSRRVAREGGGDNAWTSRDVTAYHQTVEAGRLPLVALMEADRLRAAAIPAAEVEPERGVVLEERRLRTEANPRGRFREAYDAAMWGREHWRGRPIIGWPGDIAATTRGDLAAFHEAWYAPGNAVLVVHGAASADALRRVVEDEYGGVEARALPADARAPLRGRAPVPADAAPLESRLVRQDAQVREASLLRSWVAPSLTWGESRHAHALDVLAHLLGGGPGSRLHRALVEGGLAVSAGAYYGSDDLGPSAFALFGTPRRDATPARLEAAAEAEIARLLDGGGAATEAEVERSKRQITAGALLALDGIGAAARMFGPALAIGLPMEAVEFWPARIRAVTAEEVNAAARAVLARPSMAGWLLPEGVSAS